MLKKAKLVKTTNEAELLDRCRMVDGVIPSGEYPGRVTLSPLALPSTAHAQDPAPPLDLPNNDCVSSSRSPSSRSVPLVTISEIHQEQLREPRTVLKKKHQKEPSTEGNTHGTPTGQEEQRPLGGEASALDSLFHEPTLTPTAALEAGRNRPSSSNSSDCSTTRASDGLVADVAKSEAQASENEELTVKFLEHHNSHSCSLTPRSLVLGNSKSGSKRSEKRSRLKVLLAGLQEDNTRSGGGGTCSAAVDVSTQQLANEAVQEASASSIHNLFYDSDIKVRRSSNSRSGCTPRSCRTSMCTARSNRSVVATANVGDNDSTSPPSSASHRRRLNVVESPLVPIKKALANGRQADPEPSNNSPQSAIEDWLTHSLTPPTTPTTLKGLPTPSLHAAQKDPDSHVVRFQSKSSLSSSKQDNKKRKHRKKRRHKSPAPRPSADDLPNQMSPLTSHLHKLNSVIKNAPKELSKFDKMLLMDAVVSSGIYTDAQTDVLSLLHLADKEACTAASDMLRQHLRTNPMADSLHVSISGAVTQDVHSEDDSQTQTSGSPTSASPRSSRSSSVASSASELSLARRSSTRSTTQSTKYSTDAHRLAALVPDLAMSSFQLSSHDEPICVGVSVEAAVMFVDVSGYTKICAMLENKGAFALYNAVNSYLTLILQVVEEYGGQVIKFAGDAIMVGWHYESLQQSVRVATHCAWALQQRCGEHPVKGADGFLFKLHIGIVAGPISSTVFRSPTVRNMAQNFHLLSGEPLRVIGVAVDTAKPGEICVSESVFRLCCSSVEAEEVDASEVKLASTPTSSGPQERFFKLRHVHSPSAPETSPPTAPHGCDCDLQHLPKLQHSIGTDAELDWENSYGNLKGFVPPSVAAHLKAGKQQSSMAEMRLITVLFIHKTDDTIDIGDWFEEVQCVVDSFRCAILQIIDDDKGVHIVAVVNLLTADREPAVTGIQLAKALHDRRAGCTIGAATGVTFSGLVGNEYAQRFDITGATCVRACRLMQYGLSHNQPVVIGESVVAYSADASLTAPIGETHIKGIDGPVKLYGIATIDTRILSAICGITNECPDVHVEQFKTLRRGMIDECTAQRQAAIVRGSSCTGKTTLCIRTAYDTGHVVLQHYSVQDSKANSLLWTVARWFEYHRIEEVSTKAKELLSALDKDHNIRSTSLALDLIEATIKHNLKHALVVRHCQRLDAMSLSFLRQSLRRSSSEGSGRWLVLATVVPQYGLLPWSAIAAQLGDTSLNVHTGPLPRSEAVALIASLLHWAPDTKLTDTILDITNNIAGCIHFVVQLIERRFMEDMAVSRLGVISGKLDACDRIRLCNWQEISRPSCAKYSQLLSAIPASSMSVLKVMAVLSTPYVPINKAVAVRVCSSLYPNSMKKKTIVKEVDALLDLELLRKAPAIGDAPVEGELIHNISDDWIEFESCATRDVVRSLVLPEEWEKTSKFAVEILEKEEGIEYIEEFFGLAHYHHGADEGGQKFNDLMRRGCRMLEDPATEIEEDQRQHLMHLVHVDLVRKGFLKDHHSVFLRRPHQQELGKHELLPEHVVALKKWRPPISLGALTICLRATVFVICRLCTDAAAGVETPQELLDEHYKKIKLNITFKDQIDRIIGFKSPVADEAALLRSVCTPGVFATVCKNALRFQEYTEAVVWPRRCRLHEHVSTSLYVPYPPSYEPLFQGSGRVAQEIALKNVLKTWERCQTSALRDGLMEMATQGWIPKNPELSVEHQRDCYVRKRTASLDCFMCFLFLNLNLSIV